MDNKHSMKISYAISFTSFLVRKVDPKKIRSIILYGSVARKTSGHGSDIDIFIDVIEPTKILMKKLNSILTEFYESKEAILFKLLRIDNEISLVVGDIDNQKELKRSILSDGIVLWGKYRSETSVGGKHHAIVFWNGIERNRGAFLNKIYGYRTGKETFKGFLERSDGTKLGKSCIMIPIAYLEEMREIIKKYSVKAKVIEVFT